MHRGISTHLFLQQRLSPGLLETLQRAGAQFIEVFAARHHFDYTDRNAVREAAQWFRSNDVTPTLHMPLYPDAEWSRHTEPSLNLIDTNKASRIEAMDEVKRALEAAEQVPFRSCILHLGLREDKWSTRALDDSLTAVEHLKAFAGPLGVKLLLENLTNEVAMPVHLAEIVQVGHFSGVGYCLDTGHAHLTLPSDDWRSSRRESVCHEYGSVAPLKDGLLEALEVFGDGLMEMHLHDNCGTRDEHCWPGDAATDGVDWGLLRAGMGKVKEGPLGMLEISHEQEKEGRVTEKAASAWRLLEGAEA